jgi:hypothetical protein
MKLGTVLVLAAFLTACGPDVDVNNPEYQIGYQDGCDTAITYDPQFSKKIARNEGLWDASPGYRNGWKAGFGHCRPPGASGSNSDIPGRDL